MISDSQITDVLSDYGVRPSTAQCARVSAYISLLLRWNRAISLTSVTDELEILKFHFGESVFALSVIEGIDGRLADVGAGAGFPGLPIRIFRDALQLILIEPNAKKAAFLSEVVRELSLDGVQVVRARFQQVESNFGGKVDVVASRALGGYEELLRWSERVLSVDGKIVLWIGERDASEIVKNRVWRWLPTISIPFSKHRLLLYGSPVLLESSRA